MRFGISQTLALTAMVFLASCTEYKPYRNGQASGANAESNAATVDVSVVVANTKLAALGGSLTARVTYGTLSSTQEFSPSGTQSELKSVKLPAGKAGVMTVEILQGNIVKFIAKRANTDVQAGASIVVDDCLILRAPWAGTVNEGSCEWSITEVAN
ncbi:MAG: hypothetical protein M3Q07_18315 [Pseudobdellovibrionaceae bacterium]|nr:hypothetical protein [Pseudobdellovibrionaceae bacterium]